MTNYTRGQTLHADELNASFDERVNRSGDSMSGPLTLSRDPVDFSEAATKQYVDRHIDTVVAHPNGFAWPFNTYPVTVSKYYGRFSTDIDPRSLVNSSIFTTTNFIFVDGVNGVDATAAVVSNVANYATSPAKSMGKALQLGNATGSAYRVLVKAGTYDRSLTPHFFGTYPSQHLSIEAWGGRVVFGNFDVLSWSLDGTFTSCYKATRSNVSRVFDITNKDANGYYTELTLVADATTCNTTPNSWVDVSNTTLYVRRADGAAVTNANTRAYLGAALETLNMPNAVDKDLYISGLDIEGGATGCLHGSAAHRNIVGEDCTFRYSGSIATPIDCVQLVSQAGLCAFFRCDASYSSKDGFNAHYTAGPATNSYVLTVDCTGKNNGRGTSTSNNGFTLHETCMGIDINGRYDGCYGGNVHNIGTSQMWCVGTTSTNSLGDVPLGGTYLSASFRLDQGPARMWLDGCLAQGSLIPIDCLDATAIIYTHECRLSGGINRQTGAITPY